MKNRKQKIIVAIISLVAALLVQGNAQAFTWHVDQNDADCNDVVGMPFCSIQPAFDAASDGDVVVIASGTYTENLSVADKGLSFEGAGATATVIDGSGGGTAVRFTSSGPTYTIGISDLTIQNGTDGGVFVDNGTVDITDSIITQNAATSHGGGGVALTQGELTVTDSEIDENQAVSCGGIYVASGTTHIANSTVRANEVTGTAGGFCQTSGVVTIENSSLNDNVAGGSVGGMYVVATSFSLTDSFVDGNEATTGSGGGMILSVANATLDHASVSHNAAGNAVGGLYQMTGNLTITESVIDGNLAVNSIAGLLHDNGTFILRRSTVSNNGSRNVGGGIYTGNLSTFIAVNSTISGNWAFADAAGILSGGTTWLGNVTVTNNTSDYNDDGVGIGGGVFRNAGTLTVTNSLIAGNNDLSGASPDCYGSISSAGNNIVGNNTGCSFTALASDQVGTTADPIDPFVDDLLNNGGDTETHALLAGSPAVDAGDPSGCEDGFGNPLTVDQRGFDRPVGSACDIGAFEVGDCGDGYVDEGEICDDGNSTAGDGCDSTCQVETPVVEPEAEAEPEAETVETPDLSDTSDSSDLSDSSDDTDPLTEDAATSPSSGGCSLAVQGSQFAVSGYGMLVLFGLGLVGLLHKRVLV